MTTILHDGHHFHRNRSVGNTSYYKCSNSKIQRCKARLIIKNGLSKQCGKHSCSNDTSSNVIFVESFISEFLENEALDFRKSPSSIFRDLLVKITESFQGKTFVLPRKEEIKNRIRYIRGRTNLNNSSFEIPPWSETKQGLPFLRCNYYGLLSGIYQRIMVWASQEALSILKSRNQCFVDATFKVTPHGFEQCFIVMAHDLTSGVNVPCVWALMSSKNYSSYCEIFNIIYSSLNYAWQPAYIVSDFENSLLKSIGMMFPKTKIVGCFFHFSQALLRKMTKLKIDDNIINVLLIEMQKLSSLQENLIQDHLSMIEENSNFQSLPCKAFLKYFRGTWMKKFPPKIWTLAEDQDINVARTNNCLERYNRQLGEIVSRKHPSLASFIETIQDEEEGYSSLVRGIRSGQVQI